MKITRRFAPLGVALTILVSVMGVPGSAAAATWAYKDTYSTSGGYCGTAVYARAGYVNFHRGGGSSCYYNSTVTSVDDDLRSSGDTFNNGSTVEGWDNQFINIANNSVTNWIARDCGGAKVTVTSSFSTALSYRSFKRNNSTPGC